MFDKIFYFFKKYKWSPFLIWKSLLIPLLILDKVPDSPNFQERPLLVKNDTSLMAPL